MRIGDPSRSVSTCGLCEEPTPHIATQRCDRCWELEKRVQMDPELALVILKAIKDVPVGEEVYFEGYKEAISTHYWASAKERDRVLETKRKELGLEEEI